jgi:hypothetical protein
MHHSATTPAAGKVTALGNSVSLERLTHCLGSTRPIKASPLRADGRFRATATVDGSRTAVDPGYTLADIEGAEPIP